MAININEYKNTFTKNRDGDKIKTDNNSYPNLTDEQKSNINSAYNAKKSGIISEKQYTDNLKKNGISSGSLNPSSNLLKEFKREKSSLASNYNEIIKTPKVKQSEPQKPKIPSEKLEQERLRNLTGEYNLEKVKPEKLESSIRLRDKTPDDYYRERFDDLQKERERIDEAFGPKTDFSISNFENNYDKMNKEEKGMLTHKMQLTFNKLGYRDKDGYSLKTDGILGNKTRGVYEQYIKDNKKDYDEVIERKNASSRLYNSPTNSNSVFSTRKTSNVKFDNLYDDNSNVNFSSLYNNNNISENDVILASAKNKKTITTPIEDLDESTENKNKSLNVIESSVNYTMAAIIQQLIDAKKKYINAEKSGNAKQMKIQKEIGKYIKAMIKMSNEFSSESGDKKFAEMVQEAEYFDMYGTDSNVSIEKWNDIQKYSIELAENSQAQVDASNNARGITRERIFNDISTIYKAFEQSDDPVIYISAASYAINPDDIADVNKLKDKNDEYDYYAKLTYYYTNNEKEKDKYRRSLLPADVDSDIGEARESGAGDYINQKKK